MKEYFMVMPDNSQAGPFPANELKQKGLKADTLVWAEGMSEWVVASSVPELYDVLNPRTRHQEETQFNTEEKSESSEEFVVKDTQAMAKLAFLFTFLPWVILIVLLLFRGPHDKIVYDYLSPYGATRTWTILTPLLYLATIYCGFLSVISLSKANTYKAEGLREKAVSSAGTAKILNFLTIAFGIVTSLFVLYPLFG